MVIVFTVILRCGRDEIRSVRRNPGVSRHSFHVLDRDDGVVMKLAEREITEQRIVNARLVRECQRAWDSLREARRKSGVYVNALARIASETELSDMSMAEIMRDIARDALLEESRTCSFECFRLSSTVF